MTDKVDVSFLEKGGLSNWRGADELVLELAKTYKEEDAELSTLLTLSDAANYISKNMQLAAIAKQKDGSAPHWWLFKTARDYLKMRSNLMLQSVSTPNASLKEYLKYHSENFLSDRDVQDVASLVTFGSGNGHSSDLLILFDVAQSGGSTDAEKEVAAQALIGIMAASPDAVLNSLLPAAGDEKISDVLRYIIIEAQKYKGVDRIFTSVIANFDSRLKSGADDGVRAAIADVLGEIPTLQAYNLLKELFIKETNSHVSIKAVQAFLKQCKKMKAHGKNSQVSIIETEISNLLVEKAQEKDRGAYFQKDLENEFFALQRDEDYLSLKQSPIVRQIETWVMHQSGGVDSAKNLQSLKESDPDAIVKKLAGADRLWSPLDSIVENNNSYAGVGDFISFKTMGQYVPQKDVSLDEFRKELGGSRVREIIYEYEFFIGLGKILEALDKSERADEVEKLLTNPEFGTSIKKFVEKRTGKWNITAEFLQKRLELLYKIKADLEAVRDGEWDYDGYKTAILSKYDLLSVVGNVPQVDGREVWDPAKIYLSDVTTNLANGVGLSPAEVTKMAFKALADPTLKVDPQKLLADPNLKFMATAEKLANAISEKKWAQTEELLKNLKSAWEAAYNLQDFIKEYRGSAVGPAPSGLVEQGLERLSTYIWDVDAATKDVVESILIGDSFLRDSKGKYYEEHKDVPVQLAVKVKELLESLNLAWKSAEELNISKNVSNSYLIGAIESSQLFARSEYGSKTGIIDIEPRKTPKVGLSTADIVMQGLNFIDAGAKEFIEARYLNEHAEYVPLWTGEGQKELLDWASAEFLASIKNVKELFDSIEKTGESWKETEAWKTLFKLKFDSAASAKFLANLFCETKMFYCDNGGENKIGMVETEIKEFLDAVQVAQEEDADKKVDDYLNDRLALVIGDYEKLSEFIENEDYDGWEEYLADSKLGGSQLKELWTAGPFEHDTSYINALAPLIDPSTKTKSTIQVSEGSEESEESKISQENQDRTKKFLATGREEMTAKKKVIDDALGTFGKAKLGAEDKRRQKELLSYLKELVREGIGDKDLSLYQDLDSHLKGLRNIFPIKAADGKLLASLDRVIRMASEEWCPKNNDSSPVSCRHPEIDSVLVSFYNLLRKCNRRIEAADAIKHEIEEDGAFDDLAEHLLGWRKIGNGVYEESRWNQNNKPILKDVKYSQKDVAVEVLKLTARAVVRSLQDVPLLTIARGIEGSQRHERRPLEEVQLAFRQPK